MAIFGTRIKHEELLRIKHDVLKALSQAQKEYDDASAGRHVHWTGGGQGHISETDAKVRDGEEREAFVYLLHKLKNTTAQLQAFIDSMWKGTSYPASKRK